MSDKINNAKHILRFSRFIIKTGKHKDVRRYILLFFLCCIFFVLPLQVYIIGDFTGIGVQGAVYRYQISGYGTSLIPINRDIIFITMGIYSGKTALSVVLWVLGTALVTCTTIFSFIHVDDTNDNYSRQIIYGLIASCVCYLLSCVAQYGFFFHGPAGISLPVGVIMILFCLVVMYYSQECVPQAEGKK